MDDRSSAVRRHPSARAARVAGARRLRAGRVRHPRRAAEPRDAGAGALLARAHGAPLGQRQRRGRRQRADGGPAPADLAPPAAGRGTRPGRRRRPALHGRPHLLRLDRRRREPGAAHRGAARHARLRGAVERRGDGQPRRARAARGRDADDLLADRLLRARAWGPRVHRLLPRDGGDRARPRLLGRLVLGERRALQGAGPARGHPALLPRDAGARLRVVAHHRPQPLLDEHLPDLQPRPAVLDPGAQRRDQHDRPAARAERAARPADHPRRLGQPGPQPAARGPDLREGPLAARGRRVRAAADPGRGAPAAGQAPGPLRALPRGARALRPGPGGPRLPGGRRDGVRRRRARPAAAVVDRDRGPVRRLVRAGDRGGRRARARPRPAGAGREGGPPDGRGRRPGGARLLGGPARGLPPGEGPRGPPDGRDPRPAGRRPRPGRGRGVPRRGPAGARARARDAAGLGRLDRERQAAAPIPRGSRRRADRLARLGRPPRAVHAGPDAAVGLPPGDGRRRHEPRDRPRARGRALLDARGAGPPAPDRGRRAGAAPALRAADAHHSRRHARGGDHALAARDAARRGRPGRRLHGGRPRRVGLARRAPAAALLP